jgi:AraC family transcriptional regulator
MEFRIENLSPKKLIGKHLTMTFAENKTAELWKGFMPRRKEITNNLNRNLISMQVYDKAFDFKIFNPNLPFEKWATVEVSDFNDIPEGMESFELPGGLYAVFFTKATPEMLPQPSNIFSEPGCQNQNMNWTTGRILRS